MELSIRAESLKDYDKNLMPYYVKEIVPYAAKRMLFEPEDVGRLGVSAAHLGMEKIRAKTPTGKFIIQFLNKATIHGLNHIAAPCRHLVERILTILFLGVALACTGASSLYSWYQYQNNPTSMVVDFHYENFNVTKPAVTVCLFDKVSTDKFPEVFKKFGVEDTQKARDFFLFISSPEYSTLNQTPIYIDTPPDKWLEILRDLYVEVELDKCSVHDLECMDSNSTTAVDIITEKGMCTTIHGTSADYASVNYWLSDNWTVFPKNTLPVYTYIYRNERITVLNIPGVYEESVAIMSDNIIAFHHPNELPKYGDSWYQYTKWGILDVQLDIQEVESSDDLRKLSQRQRPCNYPEDGKLKMWPLYTYNMCVMECRYNFFKSKCGCYPHFARSMPGVPICNATQLHCIGNLANSVDSLLDKDVNFCTCPDSCDTARYRGISFLSKDANHHNDHYVSNRLLNIDIQFPFWKLRNEVFFGFNEFLVSVGGAAGLFLGASILSFVEILYYITLRLFWYMKNIYKEDGE